MCLSVCVCIGLCVVRFRLEIRNVSLMGSFSNNAIPTTKQVNVIFHNLPLSTNMYIKMFITFFVIYIYMLHNYTYYIIYLMIYNV